MTRKYIKMVLFYSLICILFYVLKAFSNNDPVVYRENKFTIVGQYTYADVFNLLGSKSNRSVLGSSIALTLSRDFYIYDKKFSVAVDHVSKNLHEDGFLLSYDSLYFYIQPFPIPEKETLKKQYKIYLPYSKKYLVTDNEEEYLNSLQKDKEKYIIDSINIFNRSKIYRIDIEVMGFTDQKTIYKGIDTDNKISLQISKDILNTVINMNLGFMYSNYKINNDYNFYRNIVTYTNRDTCDFLFGSEERRLTSKITNDKVITDSYESIYNGLNVKIQGSSYDLRYKVSNDQINISGYKDSVMYCQSKIKGSTFTTRYRYINSKSINGTTFYLYALIKKKEVNSLTK